MVWVQLKTLAIIYLFFPGIRQLVISAKKANDALKHEAWEKEQAAEEYLEDEGSTTEDLRLQIENAINLLPPQQKKVFLLSRYERLKYDEIAVQLNISPETVKKHLQAAIKSLKKRVNDGDTPIIVAILLSPLMMR